MYEIYTITNNDTLSSVSEKYNTTEQELKKINGLKEEYTLIPNTQIIVPVRTNETYEYYTVKNGDNIYNIAKNNNTDYNILLKINGLDKEDYIYPNQTILIPKSNITYYLTKQNDTINKLIEKTNMKINEILEKNKDIYLEPDQMIIVKEK